MRPIAFLRLAAPCALLLALPGCFTLGVWGLQYRPFDDNEIEATDDGVPWTWRTVGTRLLLTPFSLLLDVATSPVQLGVLWLEGKVDIDIHRDRDHDGDRSPRRRH